MGFSNRIYRRTEAGEDAVTSTDIAVPSEYRRMLAFVNGATHIDVIRACLREHSDKLLADWLGELEEIGYLNSWPAETMMELDLAEILPGGPVIAALVDKQRLPGVVRQGQTASKALQQEGAYLSLDRLRNQKPLLKTCSEIAVLIVEDDPDQLALVDLRVSMAGYQVRVAGSRAELIGELRSRPLPDLLLLDVMLPDGSGFDILGMIRSHPKLAPLRVVLLTALTAEEDIRRGIALGADGYITKPYSKKMAVGAIRTVLKHD